MPLSITKLANSDDISKNLPKKDQDSFLELHNKIGFEALSIKEWTKYYRLAALSILQDPKLIDEYVQARKDFSQSKSTSAETLSVLLKTYPILMTEEEEDWDIQNEYSSSLGDDIHHIEEEKYIELQNPKVTEKKFWNTSSNIDNEEDRISQNDIIDARKNSEG